MLDIDNYSLCRDVGLMVMPDSRNVNDNIREMFFKIFISLNFEIEFDMNKKVVQYFDVELNPQTSSVYLYINSNAKLRYVNTRSNHPVRIIKYILKGLA